MRGNRQAIDRTRLTRLTSVAVTLAVSSAAAAQEAPRLSLPLGCGPGVACVVQSYVDVDPGLGFQDYACGTATYDGHKGTDFRLLSAAQVQDRVPVLAAADGTVKGMRDGMEDAFVTPESRSAIANRECGNGAVIDHGGGWETQYCHLHKGSLAVKSGDAVRRGQKIGEVGFSGLVEFAHVHLEVRKDGKTVDPFTGADAGDACIADTARRPGALWDDAAGTALAYANGQILSTGFSARVPIVEGIERDHALPLPTAASDQLVFVARFLNLRAGDVIEIKVTGPQGFAVESTSEPLERTKATYVAYAGKKRTTPAWAHGQYSGRARLLRGAAAVAELEGSVMLGSP